MHKILRPEDIATMSPSDYIEYFHCTLINNNHVQLEMPPALKDDGTAYMDTHRQEILDRLETFANAQNLQEAAKKLPGLDAIRKARGYMYTFQQEAEYYTRSVCNGDLDLIDDYSDDITELYTALRATSAQAHQSLISKYPLTALAENIASGINGNNTEYQYFRLKALDAVLHGGDYQAWLDRATTERKKAIDA